MNIISHSETPAGQCYISTLPVEGIYDYDLAMMPRAKAVLDHLKTRPDFRWWNRWIRKPESLRKFGGDAFLGWDSFLYRNMGHELSRAIVHEFRRVYGVPLTLRSSLE